MYNKIELIASLKAIISFLGRIPTKEEMINKKPSLPTYAKFFGSFENALAEAQGLKKEEPKITRSECLISAIKKRADELGRTPEAEDFRAKGSEPSYRSIVREFGSFSSALRAADFKTRVSAMEARTEIGQKLIIPAIIEFVQKNQRLPSKNDLDDHSTLPSFETLETVFGSLEKLFKLAGVLSKNGEPIAKHFHPSMIQKLRALEILTDGKPLGRQCDELARLGLMFCQKTYEREFGSWQSALEKSQESSP